MVLAWILLAPRHTVPLSDTATPQESHPVSRRVNVPIQAQIDNLLCRRLYSLSRPLEGKGRQRGSHQVDVDQAHSEGWC
jgi:hypothetical protein